MVILILIFYYFVFSLVWYKRFICKSELFKKEELDGVESNNVFW